MRERLVSQRTGIINQILALFLLERGVAVRQGLRVLRAELPRGYFWPHHPMSCSPRMVRIVEGLVDDWRRLDERIDTLSDEIEADRAPGCAGCERLMSVPGIGPDHLQRDGGRDWHRGCVYQGARLCRLAGARRSCQQISTGDRTILGKNIQARQSLSAGSLFVQAAWGSRS